MTDSTPVEQLCAMCHHDHVNGYTQERGDECVDFDGFGDTAVWCRCTAFLAPTAVPAAPATSSCANCATAIRNVRGEWVHVDAVGPDCTDPVPAAPVEAAPHVHEPEHRLSWYERCACGVQMRVAYPLTSYEVVPEPPFVPVEATRTAEEAWQAYDDLMWEANDTSRRDEDRPSVLAIDSARDEVERAVEARVRASLSSAEASLPSNSDRLREAATEWADAQDHPGERENDHRKPYYGEFPRVVKAGIALRVALSESSASTTPKGDE